MEREHIKYIKKCIDSMDFFIATQYPYMEDKELANVVREELKSMNCNIDIKVIKDAIRKYSNNGGDDDIRFY